MCQKPKPKFVPCKVAPGAQVPAWHLELDTWHLAGRESPLFAANHPVIGFVPIRVHSWFNSVVWVFSVGLE